MKMKRGIGFYVLFVLISAFSFDVLSQAPVETSNEKVIISGTSYYIHQVKKGQTSYSIARAYGVSVQELTAENPPALYGIKEGQTLRIRVVSSAKAPETSPVSFREKDETMFTYHNLKPGETVFALSRLYGVSEAEIVRSNPGIEIHKLSVGSEIAVPRKDFMSQKQRFEVQDKKFIYHKVENGETLSSIAQKYDMPLRILRRENRNLRFPKVGDYVRVPASALPETEPVEPLVGDTAQLLFEEPVLKLERPAGYTAVGRMKGSMNVAVLLPFYLQQNANRINIDSSMVIKGRKQYKLSKVPDEWIYPWSLDFVEMYNGILLAADTLRSLGLDINIQAFDIKKDTIGVTKLIRSGQLARMDLIIGPVYSDNLKIVSEYAGARGIPVVSPVSLINNSVLSGNPTLFMASSSLEVAQKTLSKQISENNNSNLVFIHTDSLGNDEDVKRYREQIFNELTQKMPYEDIRFRELIFYPRSAFGNDSINRISHTLSEHSENIVIIASEEAPVVSEIITIVHGLTKRYNVRVYGYPSMIFLDKDNLDPRIFYELNQLIYSPYRIDYSKNNVRQFNLNYRKKFLTMPLEISFAWIGYDIAYFFMSGLGVLGDDFIAHPELHNPELLQNEFDFERKTIEDGYENQKLFKTRYTRSYEIVTEN